MSGGAGTVPRDGGPSADAAQVLSAGGASGAPALRLQGVSAGYGATNVLHDVDLTVAAGQVVALVGPNGAGKSTVLGVASGAVRCRSGRVEVAGRDVTGRPAHVFARAGVCLLPEGRGIFPSLSVLDNLRVQVPGRPLDELAEAAAALFPPLGARMRQSAGSLSGGEQQMLALCRACLTDPTVVLVDEASLGLAPLVVDRVYEVLHQLVAGGLALVVVEQYVHKVLELADVVHVLSRGRVVHTAAAADTDPETIYRRYLGIEATVEVPGR